MYISSLFGDNSVIDIEDINKQINMCALCVQPCILRY